ncbi:hypothetical protein M9Y10_029147 [Tritrichomonas musculus]|uniref:Uncharacterized protein n=1 Tax=Tritrichomonas musculus TaxID=1915356 RepID=A0ABR2KLC2_9EUKA
MSKSEISILSDIQNPKFDEQLRKFSSSTDGSNAFEVFNALLSNFDSKKKNRITNPIGIAILSAIAAIIQRPRNISIFISKGFLNNLPYGVEDYSDVIFDIFCICLKSDINVFDDENKYVTKFEKQISFNPHKALIIIAMHVSNFKYIAHPWCLSDLLISQFPVFLSSAELASSHLSLIEYLCSQFPTYRKHRTTQCWSLLSQLLESDIVDQKIIKQIYSILFTISSNNSEVKKCFHFLPVNRVIEHIEIPFLKEDVLSFIAINTKEFKSCTDLINILLVESRKNEKASLILMKLSEEESNALYLISDDNWFQYELPTYLDTLKIVYCCLDHSKVRMLASKSKRIIPLLIKSSKKTLLSIIVIILGIIQKLHLSKHMVSEMSKYGLLNNIIRTTNSNKDNAVSDKILYRIFSAIAEISYANELLKLFVLASEDIVYQSELYEEALNFVVKAVRYKECVNNMKSTKLFDYFKHIKNNMHNIKKDKEIQRNIETIQQIISILDEAHEFDDMRSDENDDDYYEGEEEEEEYMNESYSNNEEEEEEEEE